MLQSYLNVPTRARILWCGVAKEHKGPSGVRTKNEAGIFTTQPLQLLFLLPSPDGFIFYTVGKKVVMFRNNSQTKMQTNMGKGCKDCFYPIIPGLWRRPEQRLRTPWAMGKLRAQVITANGCLRFVRRRRASLRTCNCCFLFATWHKRRKGNKISKKGLSVGRWLKA